MLYVSFTKKKNLEKYSNIILEFTLYPLLIHYSQYCFERKQRAISSCHLSKESYKKRTYTIYRKQSVSSSTRCRVWNTGKFRW